MPSGLVFICLRREEVRCGSSPSKNIFIIPRSWPVSRNWRGSGRRRLSFQTTASADSFRASCRTRTSARGDAPRYLPARALQHGVSLARRRAPDPRTYRNGLWCKGFTGGSHRIDCGARHGRQGSSISRSLLRHWTLRDINDALANCRLPAQGPHHRGLAHTGDPALWRKRFHCAADPGRPATFMSESTVGRVSSSRCCSRDWLAANSGVRVDYLAAKRRALSAAPDYAGAKEPWFADAYERAWAWAKSTGWRP